MLLQTGGFCTERRAGAPRRCSAFSAPKTVFKLPHSHGLTQCCRNAHPRTSQISRGLQQGAEFPCHTRRTFGSITAAATHTGPLMSLYDSALVTVKVMTLGPESTMTPLLQYTALTPRHPAKNALLALSGFINQIYDSNA